MQNRTVLYVTGFSPSLRARDLAWEFERFGRLVRCDIPALKSASSSPFAFVEFRREDDAEDAYYDMHGRTIDGRRITVQWAKRPPSAAWRHEDYRRDRGYNDRARSPPRRRSPSPRRRSPSPPRRDERADREYERERDSGRDSRDERDEPRAGDRDRDEPRDEPRDDRRRSTTPPRKNDDDDRRDDRDRDERDDRDGHERRDREEDDRDRDQGENERRDD